MSENGTPPEDSEPTTPTSFEYTSPPDVSEQSIDLRNMSPIGQRPQRAFDSPKLSPLGSGGRRRSSSLGSVSFGEGIGHSSNVGSEQMSFGQTSEPSADVSEQSIDLGNMSPIGQRPQRAFDSPKLSPLGSGGRRRSASLGSGIDLGNVSPIAQRYSKRQKIDSPQFSPIHRSSGSGRNVSMSSGPLMSSPLKGPDTSSGFPGHSSDISVRSGRDSWVQFDSPPIGQSSNIGLGPASSDLSFSSTGMEAHSSSGIRGRSGSLPLVANLLEGLEAYDYTIVGEESEPPHTFVSKIGKGTYSSVYRGRNLKNGEQVAIKVSKVKDEGYTLTITFEKEVWEALQRNKHPNIVALFFVVERVDRAFYIFELSEIGDLFNAMQSPNSEGIQVWVPVNEREARHLITGIANGLSHMHGLNIAHGDLKPQNVLLFKDLAPVRPGEDKLKITGFDRMTPKLTDFGNSRQRTERDPQGKILAKWPMCTISYAAPESYYLAEGQSFDMIAADYFSLGATLLAMLLGARPYDPPLRKPENTDPDFVQKAEQFKQTLTKMKRDLSFTKSLCNGFSTGLRDVIPKLLDPLPENRITVQQFLTQECMSRRPTLTSIGRTREYEDIFTRKASFEKRSKDY